MPYAQNPLRIIALPIESQTASLNFRIGSQRFDVDLVSGGETELIVGQ